jgi:LacI family transcriptional regulator
LQRLCYFFTCPYIFYPIFGINYTKVRSSNEVTIYDVAKALNLSPSTVSRALKDNPHIKKETRKKIKQTAVDMGYRHNKFASSLRQKHTNSIGVVAHRLDSFFMASVLSGIEKVATENGYGLIISQSQESWKKEISCVSTLFNARVDGLLVSLAFETKNLDHYNLFFDKELPIVFFDRVPDCHKCMNVIIDNYKAGYEAATHLIQQGCKRIAHIGGNLLRNVYSERLGGFKQAHIDNNLDFDPNLLFITNMTVNDGYDVAKKILKMKPIPDGLFTSNDTTGVSAIVEFRKAGLRIPDDIAVIGFNNDPISQVVQPNLTTVDYPAREIGEVSAEMLINQLKNKQSSSLSKIVLRHELIIRQSSLRK